MITTLPTYMYELAVEKNQNPGPGDVCSAAGNGCYYLYWVFMRVMIYGM